MIEGELKEIFHVHSENWGSYYQDKYYSVDTEVEKERTRVMLLLYLSYEIWSESLKGKSYSKDKDS